MVRPRINRRIFFQPDVTYFKPAGIRMNLLSETILTFEEVEAIRLIDYENIQQGKAAKQMKISQPTLSRILNSARKKIADAIINGKAIRVQGGAFNMVQSRGQGLGRGAGLGRGRGQGLGRGAGLGRGGGRMGGFAAGPSGNCVCPKCGHKQAHQTGVPCYQMKCPKCGTQMTRAE